MASTAEKETGIVVFDICDTLYYSNTTFDFIRFVLQTKRMTIGAGIFKLLTKKISPVFIGLYLLQKISKEDTTKKLALKLLKGLSKTELYDLGKAFAAHYLSSRSIAQTHTLFTDFKKQGKQIILISASIDPVVGAIAENLGVEFRCSVLEYDQQGNFTGNLVSEMTGNKFNALQSMLPAGCSDFAVATDNFSDRGLVEAACQRYVVIYNEKAEAFWKDLNPNFIKLYS